METINFEDTGSKKRETALVLETRKVEQITRPDSTYSKTYRGPQLPRNLYSEGERLKIVTTDSEEFSPVNFSDSGYRRLADQYNRILAQSKNPEEDEARIQMSSYLAGRTDYSPEYIFQNSQKVMNEVFGYPMDLDVRTTWDYLTSMIRFTQESNDANLRFERRGDEIARANVSEEEREKMYDELRKDIEKFQASGPGFDKVKNWIPKDFIDGLASTLPYMGRAFTGNIAGRAIGWGAGTIAAMAFPASIPLMLTTAFLGKAGGILGSMLSVQPLLNASTYADRLVMKDNNGEYMDPDLANWGSEVSSWAEALVEGVAMDLFIPWAGKLFNGGQVSAIVNGSIGRAFKSGALSYVKGVAAESAEEGLQRVVRDVTDNILKYIDSNNNGRDWDYLGAAEIINNASKEFLQSVPTMAFLGLFSGGISTVQNLRGVSKAQRYLADTHFDGEGNVVPIGSILFDDVEYDAEEMGQRIKKARAGKKKFAPIKVYKVGRILGRTIYRAVGGQDVLQALKEDKAGVQVVRIQEVDRDENISAARDEDFNTLAQLVNDIAFGAGVQLEIRGNRVVLVAGNNTDLKKLRLELAKRTDLTMVNDELTVTGEFGEHKLTLGLEVNKRQGVTEVVSEATHSVRDLMFGRLLETVIKNAEAKGVDPKLTKKLRKALADLYDHAHNLDDVYKANTFAHSTKGAFLSVLAEIEAASSEDIEGLKEARAALNRKAKPNVKQSRKNMVPKEPAEQKVGKEDYEKDLDEFAADAAAEAKESETLEGEREAEKLKRTEEQEKKEEEAARKQDEAEEQEGVDPKEGPPSEKEKKFKKIVDRVLELDRKFGVRTKVVADGRGFPKKVRDAAKKAGVPLSRVSGVYVGGTVWINASAVTNLEETYIHEWVGHRGLRGLFNSTEAFKSFLQQIIESQGMNEIQRVIPKEYHNAPALVQAEEYIAYLAQEYQKNGDLSQSQKTLLQKVVDAIKKLLRSMGVNLNFTEREIRSLLADAKLAMGIDTATVTDGTRLQLDKDQEIYDSWSIDIYDGQKYIKHDEGFDYEEEKLRQIEDSVAAELENIQAPEIRYSISPGVSGRGDSTVQDWRHQKRIDFVGRVIPNAKALAELFSVYRNPELEYFHIIYVDGNDNILAHNAMTSGLPGYALAREGKDTGTMVRKMEKRMKRLGASGYYMMHNHPSGNIEPSPQDINATYAYMNNIPGFKGHVILDHDKFTHLYTHGSDIASDEVDYKPFEISRRPFQSKMLNGPRTAAQYAYRFLTDETRSIYFITDTRYRVIETRAIKQPSFLSAYEAMRSVNGHFVFLATNDNKIFHGLLLDSYKQNSKYGVFADILFLHSGEKILSVREMVGDDADPQWNKYAQNAVIKKGGRYVWENIPRYQIAPPTDSQEFQDWFKESEAVDENGDARVFYHGTKSAVQEFKTEYDDGLTFFSTNSEFAGKWGLENKQPTELGKAEEAEAREYRKQLEDQIFGDKLDGELTDDRMALYRQLKAEIDAKMVERYGFSSVYDMGKLSGSNVIPVYISAQKIFDPRIDYKMVEQFLNKLPGYEGIVANEYHKQGNWVVYENKDVIGYLKSMGYDAIWLAENIDGPHETLATFNKYQVKSIFNLGTWDPGTDDIRFQINNTSVDSSFYGDEFDQRSWRRRLGLPEKGRITVSDLGHALTSYTKRIARERDLAAVTPENITFHANHLAKIIGARLNKLGEDAVGWYEKTLEEAMEIFSIVYPELASNEDLQTVFKVALAVTSQGQDLYTNTKLAGQVYEYYKINGEFPVDQNIVKSDKSKAMVANFTRANKLIKRIGSVPKFKAMMQRSYTVGQMNRVIEKVSGENVGELLPMTVLFGPKIGGGFLSNLMGDYSQFTMDLWVTRMMARITGTLSDVASEGKIEKDLGEFRELVSSYPEIANLIDIDGEFAEHLKIGDLTKEQILTDDELLFKYATLVSNAYKKSREYKGEKGSFHPKLRTEFNKKAKIIAESTKIKEAPTQSERSYWRKIAKETHRVLQETGVNITVADMQALMWYSEKDLYAAFGIGSKRSESASYVDAAKELVYNKLGRGDAVDDKLNQIGRRERAGDAGGQEYSGLSEGGRALLGTGTGEDTESPYGEGIQRGIPQAGAGSQQGRPTAYRRRVVPVLRKLVISATGRETPVISEFVPDELFEYFIQDKYKINVFPVYEVGDPQAFHEAISAGTESLGPAGITVEVKTPDDYKNMRLFLTDGGLSGFALNGQDIVSVFKHKDAPKGVTYSLIPLSIAEGGRTLDCFDVYLPYLYSRFGFSVISRVSFDDEQAPKGWNTETMGRPDLVLMTYTLGDPDVSWAAFRERGGRGYYKPGNGELYPDWDSAAEARDKAAEEASKDEGTNTIRFQVTNEQIRARHKEAVRKAVIKGLPVPDANLELYQNEPWAQAEIKRRDTFRNFSWIVDLAGDADSAEQLMEMVNHRMDIGDPDAPEVGMDFIEEAFRLGQSPQGEQYYLERFADRINSNAGLIGLLEEIAADRESFHGIGVPQGIWSAVQKQEKGTITPQDLDNLRAMIYRNLRRTARSYYMGVGDENAISKFRAGDLTSEASGGLTAETRVKIAALAEDQTVKDKILRGDYTYSELVEYLEVYEKELASYLRYIDRTDTRIAKLENSAEANKAALADRKSEIRALEKEARENDAVVARLEKQLARKDSKNEKLEAELAAAKARAKQVQSEIRQKRDEKINDLSEIYRERIRRLREEKNRKLEEQHDAMMKKQRDRDALRKERERMKYLFRRVQRPVPPGTVDYSFGSKLDMITQLFSKKITNEFGYEGRAYKLLLLLKQFENLSRKEFAAALSGLQDLRMDEFTADQLEELYKITESLRSDGRDALAAKYLERKKKRSVVIREIIGEILRGEPAKAFDHIGSKETRQEQKSTAGFKLWAATLRPTRMIDMLGGEVMKQWFVEEVNKKTDAEIVEWNRRHEGGLAKMKELGITPKDLGREIAFSGKTFTADEVIHIYIGMMNEKSKAAIIYGNMIPLDTVNGLVAQLATPELEWGLYMLEDFEENYNRLNEAFIQDKNIDMGREVAYFPMMRQNLEGVSVGIGQEMGEQYAIRNAWRKAYAQKKFSISRIDMADEHQVPIRLGATSIWLEQIDKQEHYIAAQELIKDLQYIQNDQDVKDALKQKHGKNAVEWLQKYVNDYANPNLYKTYDQTSRISRIMRNNMAIAYLSFNMLTVLKQAPSLGFYLREAGPQHLLAAAAQMISNPIESMKMVNSMDPQMLARSYNRMQEEISQHDDNRFVELTRKIGRTGMKPIMWMDRAVTTIGWMAVYNKKRATMTEVEAAREAQRVTLETQPSGRAKDLAEIYRSNEGFNWLLMFSNHRGPSRITTYARWRAYWRDLAYQVWQ